jgi:hypothetical protein
MEALMASLHTCYKVKLEALGFAREGCSPHRGGLRLRLIQTLNLNPKNLNPMIGVYYPTSANKGTSPEWTHLIRAQMNNYIKMVCDKHKKMVQNK